MSVVTINGKQYKVLAFFHRKAEANAHAAKIRRRGYYNSIRIIERNPKYATHKYWVCGRR